MTPARVVAILVVLVLTGCWRDYTFVDGEEAGPHALPPDAGSEAAAQDLAATPDLGGEPDLAGGEDLPGGEDVPADGPIVVVQFRPASASVIAGGTAILELALSAPAGPGGLSITLGASAPDLLIAPRIVIPEGSASAGVRVHAGVAGGTITAGLPPGPMATLALAVVPAASSPQAGELVINEVNYDVPTASGDASCDGTTSAFGDEFIELANRSAHPLQLEGVSLWDEFGFGENKPRFSFPAFVLGPNEVVVVFGGMLGARAASAPWCQAFGMSWLGDAAVLPNPQAFNLDNAGDTVHLTAAADRSSASLAEPVLLPPGGNQSWTRAPDFVGPFVKHGDAPGHASDRRWTPGTLLTGAPFAAQ